jgi:hypothetical protein
MLPLYSNAVARRQFTVVYHGYDLDVTRAPSGWCVGVHPKTADLPIIGRSEVFADNQDQAVVSNRRSSVFAGLLDLNDRLRRFQSQNNACLRT